MRVQLFQHINDSSFNQVISIYFIDIIAIDITDNLSELVDALIQIIFAITRVDHGSSNKYACGYRNCQ